MAERARGASKQKRDHLRKHRRAHAYTARPPVSESRCIYLHKRQINVNPGAVSLPPFLFSSPSVFPGSRGIREPPVPRKGETVTFF